MGEWTEMSVEELEAARAEMRAEMDTLKGQFRAAGLALAAQIDEGRLSRRREELMAELEEIDERLEG